MEVPNYSTKQNMMRILLPRIAILLVLAALLYFGIRINLMVFNIQFPDIINLITIIVIAVLVIADILLKNWQNKDNKIYFFSDRIEIRGKDESTIRLATITNAEVRKNMIDAIFKTGDVVLSDGQAIKNINYPERISQYIMQLLRRVPEIKKKV